MESHHNDQLDGQKDRPFSKSEIEKILLQIWADVLGLESSIGVDADFLSIGGDSMAAMRCINRISTAFGVELPIDVFLLKSASISDIAHEVGNNTHIAPHDA